MGVARSHGPLGWRRLRAHSEDVSRETHATANELHATGDLFATQIEAEPAPGDLWNGPWKKCQTTKRTDAPAPPELELIDTPPAPASVHRTARGVRWTVLSPKINCHLHHISAFPCCLTCRLSRVSCPRSCSHVLTTSPKLPDSDRQNTVFL